MVHAKLLAVGVAGVGCAGCQDSYRIRVHHAWFPWKGERHTGRRLLIMAFP
jgi:hypothetical protein